MATLTRTMVHGVASIHGDFMRWRAEKDEALRRTGQVCSLRGLLNDMFDDSYRGIKVIDTPSTEQDLLLVRKRTEENWVYVPIRPRTQIIERRGFGGTSGVDFQIQIPERLRQTLDMDRVAGVIDKYKLCSRRWSVGFYFTEDNG